MSTKRKRVFQASRAGPRFADLVSYRQLQKVFGTCYYPDENGMVDRASDWSGNDIVSTQGIKTSGDDDESSRGQDDGGSRFTCRTARESAS